MTAMRIFLTSFLLCLSAASASRVSLRGRTVEDPCDPNDEKYDPTDPACADYDEDEEGPGEEKEDGDEEDKGDDEDIISKDPCDPNDENYDPTDPVCAEYDEDEEGPGEGGPPGEDGGKEDYGEDGWSTEYEYKCEYGWCPKCDDPEFPDYDPQDKECMNPKEEEEVFGDGDDTMAEEMVDVDDGPSFEDIDADGDGAITENEAHTYGVAHGLPIDEVDDIFDYMDINEDKSVSREEFESGPSQDATEDMAPSHSDLDLNGDGEIEWLEWEAGCVCGKSYLSTCGDEEFCKDIFKAADDNEDELVSESEFNGAGEECKTADDGNCDLLALKKSEQVKKLKKFSMASWVRKHFKRSGHNLFALAKLRHQHKKGIFTKLATLIIKKHAQKTRELKAKISQLHIRHGAKHRIVKARRHVPRRAKRM